MDYDDVELAPSGVLQQLPEYGAPGNGFHVGRPPFLAIDPDDLPASVLAEFMEEAPLGIQRVPLYLGDVRDPEIAHGFHDAKLLPSREATASATSARVCRKCFTLRSATSLPVSASCGVASVYMLRILVNTSGAGSASIQEAPF